MAQGTTSKRARPKGKRSKTPGPKGSMPRIPPARVDEVVEG